jgi:hypothetical protein
VTAGAVDVGARATRRLRLALGADTLALAGLATLLAGLAAVTWGTWGDLDSDTGYDVVAGGLVAQGQLPYVDFVYYYGPLAPLLAGLATWLGGAGLTSVAALGLVLTAAIVGATYALARTFVSPLGAFLAAALTTAVAFVPNNYSYVLPHTTAATLGTLFLLGVLLALRRLAAAETTGWALAVGALVGLLALTKPEPALAGVAAVAAWLVARRWAGRAVGRTALAIAAPAAAVPALVYGAFLVAVSPHRLFLENLYPADTLSAGGDVLLRARMPLTPGSLVELGGRAAIYAVGLGLLLALAKLAERPGLGRGVAAGLVLTGGLAACAAAVANPEALRHGLQFVYGWIPFGAAAGAVWLLVRARRGALGERDDLRLAAVVALAAVAATAYNGFYLHAHFPQMAVYYAPLVAVFLAELHLRVLGRSRPAALLGAAWLAFLVAAGVGLTLKDARAESVAVHGAEGSLAETPAEAHMYATALAAIERETRPGERILVLPLLTGLEALSGRMPALPEVTVLPGVLDRPGGEREAIDYLNAHPVRLVVTDDRDWPAYGRGAFGEDFGLVLAAWLEDNYERVTTVSAGTAGPRTLTIWRRTAE